MASRRVVVTGVGAVTGFGVGVEKAWMSLIRGETSVRRSSRLTPINKSFKLLSTAPSADEIRSQQKSRDWTTLPRTTMLSVLAAEEAWAMSGLGSSVDEQRVGTYISRNFGQHEVTGSYFERLWERGPSGVSGLQFVQTIANAVLGTVAMQYHARGPSILSLGGSGLAFGFDAIRSGQVDVALTGTLDELSDFVLTMCESVGCIAASERDLSHPRPYDIRRNGLVPGDGSAFVLLEEEGHALGRGANVICCLRGYASTTDCAACTSPFERDPAAVAAALKLAFADAGVDPIKIAAVSGSGAGLKKYDQAELDALGQVFNNRVRLFSTKAALGETWGASGGMAAVAATLALRDTKLPLTLNVESFTSDSRLRPVLPSNQQLSPEDILVSTSLDFSGQNHVFIYSSS